MKRNPPLMTLTLAAFATTAVLMLTGCIIQTPSAASHPPHAGQTRVCWMAASHQRPYPALLLLTNESDKPVLEAKSIFDADAVEALGTPSGDRLQVFNSPSGNTVLVHENASESSPAYQLTIFSRHTSASPWQVRQAAPPHQPGPIYGHYGSTQGVDDTYLYYHFSAKKLKRVKLDSIRK